MGINWLYIYLKKGLLGKAYSFGIFPSILVMEQLLDLLSWEDFIH